MNRVIIYLLIIILLVFINNTINTCLHEYRLPDIVRNQYHVPKNLTENRKPQLILVGSSTTKTGYSIKDLIQELQLDQEDILNLGTMPNNAEINLYILEQLFTEFQPKLIVYSIDPWIFSEYYYQHFNYKLSRWSIKKRIKYVRKMDPKIGRIIDILNGGNMFSNVQNLIRKSTNSQLELTGDRDWHGKDPMAKIAYSEWFNYPDFGISQDFTDALGDLDRLCKDNDCKLVISIPFYSESFINEYTNTGFHEEFCSRIDDSIHFGKFDLDLYSLPDSLFWDGIHVKEEGKTHQTKRITNTIQAELSD